MEKIRLIGRNSRLSLLQLEKVKLQIEEKFPAAVLEIITRSSRGDTLQDIPLHTVEGSDFFTQDIFDALTNGEADIAVHSLKDMSSDHFFGDNEFAVIDRDDTRDIAIFRDDITSKLKKGETVVIGTCSPRREEMAINFLQKALPQWNSSFSIQTKSIRGNIDTRLRKLHSGEYDGIILATAGLNRLLASEVDAPSITELLRDKELMLLPLIECVPAPCQGAIVAEAIPANKKAVAILKVINKETLSKDCAAEKKTGARYGTGCLQRFGVTTISYGSKKVVYAAGRDNNGSEFSDWIGLPKLEIGEGKLFSTADHMGNFFTYKYFDEVIHIPEPVVYIANYKAVKDSTLISQFQQKKVWAAGTKTWYELAKQGLWVNGCADAFGLEYLKGAWKMPLFLIDQRDVAVITNKPGSDLWTEKGWAAYGTYELAEKYSPELEHAVANAGIIFWTSIRQFEQYRHLPAKNIVHACPYGETAEQLRAAGVRPVVFPTIKSFKQWSKTFTHSHNGG